MPPAAGFLPDGIGSVRWMEEEEADLDIWNQDRPRIPVVGRSTVNEGYATGRLDGVAEPRRLSWIQIDVEPGTWWGPPSMNE